MELGLFVFSISTYLLKMHIYAKKFAFFPPSERQQQPSFESKFSPSLNSKIRFAEILFKKHCVNKLCHMYQPSR